MDFRPRHAVAALLLAVAIAGCDTASTPNPADPSQPSQPSPGTVQTIASGLQIPWGMAFLPDGTALVTERRTGRVLSVTADGRVTEVHRLRLGPTTDGSAGVFAKDEAGLLGIAVSPRYATDKWVYAYYTAIDRTGVDNRIVRFQLGGPEQPILTGIPGGEYHAGGRIAFGPDGFLYATTGETFFTRDIAQDRRSLGGKILRITPEGRPAPGNPFPDSPIWSMGHRNVQGIAWDSAGRLYASEFGDKTFDELNVIEPGRNYGWPRVEGVGEDPRYTNPIATWTPTSVASPSGIAIAGDRIYVACLAGKRLYRVTLDGKTIEPMFADQYGRIRTVAAAPDGSLWFTTSNRDQLGTPVSNEDDRILRLVL